MPTMEKIDPSVIYAMFKGEPGTRKSTSALSFPTPQYWFSWDRKMQGLIVPMRNWGIDSKLIHYDDYDGWNKAETKLKEFQTNCPYNTIIADSVTSCGDMTLRQTLDSKVGVTRASGQKAGMMIAGISVNEIEDYNAESSALNKLISLTKDIQSYHLQLGKKINIILIAHVMDVMKTVGSTTVQSRTIVTAGKRVAAKIPAYCSEVYHFGIEGGIEENKSGDYICVTENTGSDFARTSLNLKKIIKFGDKPLYSDFILPAIKKLQEKPPDTMRF